MELLNQIAGVIGCLIAFLALLLAYIVAPDDKQRVLRRTVTNILAFLLFIGGLAYVVLFAAQPGPVTHAEVLILIAWLFNIRVAFYIRPKFEARSREP